MKNNSWIPFIIGVVFLLFSCNGKNMQKMTFSDSTDMSSTYDDGSKTSEDGLVKLFTDSPYNWEGTTNDGYADGNGTIYWTNSDERYVGDVSNGHITGYGSKYMGDQLVYEGNWVDGKYSGEGTLYDDESKYIGEFSGGEKSGNGAIYFSDGSKEYNGEFYNDQFHGFGKLYDGYDNCIRQGQFKNGRFEKENILQDIVNELGGEVVRQIFDGGTNLSASLYSAKFNEDNSQIEIIFDLEFSGNLVETNEYECKVACRSYYPEMEFLYKNSTADNYLTIRNLLGATLTGIDLYNELFGD